MKMNPNQNRKRGKRTEHALAKRVGGKRIGILGKDDVQTTDYSIEIKSRVKFAGTPFMEQSVRNATGTGRMPLVIVHIHGRLHGDDLVMVRLKDWELLNGEIKKYPKEG